MGPRKRTARCSLIGFICSLFVKEDWRKHEVTEQQPDEDDALFCTLCNAEVLVLDDIFSRNLPAHSFSAFKLKVECRLIIVT